MSTTLTLDNDQRPADEGRAVDEPLPKITVYEEAMPTERATDTTTTLSRWLPIASVASLLGLTLVHLLVVSLIWDPTRHISWLTVYPGVSAFDQWKTTAHILLGQSVALALCLALGLLWLSRRYTALRLPSRILTGLGALAALALQLTQPGCWELGLGLGRTPWSWELPIRVAALSAAATALLLLARPTLRRPRWVLTAALVAVGALLLVPQPTRDFQPAVFNEVDCAWAAARNDGTCPDSRMMYAWGPMVPIQRIEESLELRAQARASIARRFEPQDCPSTKPGQLEAARPPAKRQARIRWERQRGTLLNAWLFLALQDVRLIGLGLLLLVALPLSVWLLVRRRQPARRLGLAFVACAAVIAATGVMPEWSTLPLGAHLPFALLVPVALVCLVAALIRPGARPRHADRINEAGGR